MMTKEEFANSLKAAEDLKIAITEYETKTGVRYELMPPEWASSQHQLNILKECIKEGITQEEYMDKFRKSHPNIKI